MGDMGFKQGRNGTWISTEPTVITISLRFGLSQILGSSKQSWLTILDAKSARDDDDMSLHCAHLQYCMLL